MAHIFKAGDVVFLKSGGPRMTVESIETDPEHDLTFVGCAWFDKNQAKSKAFFPEALAKVWEPEPPQFIREIPMRIF